MKIFKRIILAGLFLAVSFQSNAWGLLGHRIVGQIAESYLTPKAKLEVIKILGTESIAMASNWPDFVKSDTTLLYLSPWHYLNLKGGLTYSGIQAILKNDTSINAYTRINFLVKELKNKQLAKDKKTFYLRLLIHIVGDVHQPLHVGRPDDRGGNSIRIQWFNAPFNLHQVWDSELIDLQKLSYTEYTNAINHTTKIQRLQWQKQPVCEWIWQSYEIAEKIYGDIKQEEKLSWFYNYKYIQILEKQLLIGGVHLAGLLNDIFKS